MSEKEMAGKENLGDLVVLLAIKEEFQYFCRSELIECGKTIKIDTLDRAGRCFKTKTKTKEYEGVVFLIGAGSHNSSHATQAVLEKYSAKCFVSLGISGGLKDVKVGDVVFVTEAYHYTDNMKVQKSDNGKDDKWLFQVTGGRVQTKFAEWEVQFEKHDDWSQECLKANKEALTSPEIHFGIAVSGDIVVASEEFKKKIHEGAGMRKVLAVDQENASILRMWTDLKEKPELLIVRGISDMAAQAPGQNSISEGAGAGANRKYSFNNALLALFSSLEYFISK